MCKHYFCLMLLGMTITVHSPSAHALTDVDKSTLLTIRNLIFGGSRLNAAVTQASISGQEPPVFSYQLDDRVMLVWQIQDKNAVAFADSIELFEPFRLAKVSPISAPKGLNSVDTSSPHYLLIADIAQSSGAEQGLKVEWKTFVSLGGVISLYRFAAYKQLPGNDLLEVSQLTPSDITLNKSNNQVQATLSTAEGDQLLVNIKGYSSSGQGRFTEAYLTASQRVYGRQGSQTRYYYDGSSVSANLTQVKLNKVTVSSTFPWFEYAHQLDSVIVPKESMSFLAQPITASVPVSSPPLGPQNCLDPNVPESESKLFSCLVAAVLGSPENGIQPMPPEAVFSWMFSALASTPRYIPTFYYALQDLYQGLGIYIGDVKPKLFFELESAPKTIFINFELEEDRLADFKQAYLPSHFKLAKIRFYPEQHKAVYAISLNIYKSKGANLDGLRAEWSTYVINPNEANPKPRFAVLQVQTNIGGFDPVIALKRFNAAIESGNPINLADPSQLVRLIEEPNTSLKYNFDPTNGIQASLLDEEQGIELDVNIGYPHQLDQLHTKPLRTWMEANDYVYWGEVADILKYDNQVMFADLMVFNVSSDDIIFDSTFAEYVKPEPLPIIIWKGGQSIALEPWSNLESIQVE